MQLKVQRSQRTGGAFGGKIIFVLDIRAEYTETERNNINKYSLGGEVIYNSAAAKAHLDRAGQHLDAGGSGLLKGMASLALARMNLNITIASLQKGVHIECKDLGELLEAEESVCTACQNLSKFLAAAATFDGRTDIIEFNEHNAAA